MVTVIDVPYYTLYAIISSSFITLLATILLIKYDNPLTDKAIMKLDKEEGVKEVLLFSSIIQITLMILTVLYQLERHNLL